MKPDFWSKPSNVEIKLTDVDLKYKLDGKIETIWHGDIKEVQPLTNVYISIVCFNNIKSHSIFLGTEEQRDEFVDIFANAVKSWHQKYGSLINEYHNIQ